MKWDFRSSGEDISADGLEQCGVEGILVVSRPVAGSQNYGTLFCSLGSSICAHGPPHLLFPGLLEFLPLKGTGTPRGDAKSLWSCSW